jgi:hypothetical protein
MTKYWTKTRWKEDEVEREDGRSQPQPRSQVDQNQQGNGDVDPVT